MPSRRAVVAAGLATLAVASAVAVPPLAWAALAADVLIVAAVLLDVSRARRTPLSAERLWPPLLVQGAPAAVELRIVGPPHTVVVVRETLHPGLAPHPMRQGLTLPQSGAAAWRYLITPRLRGEHEIGPLNARVLGALGFGWSQRELLPTEPRRVYPQTRWQGKVGRLLALAHRRELGRSPMRVHGAGSEPYALREYRPGDPPSRIHWKATARNQRLIARDDTWERGARLVILLDCGRAMTTLDGTRSKLDHALAAALALVRVAASRGDRVALIAFSDRVERVVRVRSGVGAISAAYGALYDLQAALADPAYDVAVAAIPRVETRRANVVLFTSLVDLAAAELLREALLGLARRHRPVLVNVEDADVARLALGVPHTPEEAFAKAAALELLLGNRRLGRRLQRAGIAVAAAPADRLAWRTLETYLSLSAPRRGAQSGLQSSGHAAAGVSGEAPSAR